MGNPLSPVLANFFLEHVESELLPSFSGIRPLHWFRYVDDCLAVVSSSFDQVAFLNFINSLYPSLNFTFVCEENNNIPF